MKVRGPDRRTPGAPRVQPNLTVDECAFLLALVRRHGYDFARRKIAPSVDLVEQKLASVLNAVYHQGKHNRRTNAERRK